jgi:hypothetical protein
VILAYPVFLVTWPLQRGGDRAIDLRLDTDHQYQRRVPNVNPILPVGASMNLSGRNVSVCFRRWPDVFGGFASPSPIYKIRPWPGTSQVGVGMWLSDAAFRFEVEEVCAGLGGTVLFRFFSSTSSTGANPDAE